VLIDVYGVSVGRFGFYFALNALGLIIGAFMNGRLAHRFSSEQLMLSGFTVLLGSGAALVGIAWWQLGGPAVLMLPIMTYVMALALIAPNSTATAMEPAPHMAGLAASLMGAIQTGSGSLSGFAVAALYDRTPMPMAGTIAAMAVGAFLSYYWLVRRRGP
jgi:DHA1 family bicyclomycin/chloramphenicol resistance-like MFS transporter